MLHAWAWAGDAKGPHARAAALCPAGDPIVQVASSALRRRGCVVRPESNCFEPGDVLLDSVSVAPPHTDEIVVRAPIGGLELSACEGEVVVCPPEERNGKARKELQMVSQPCARSGEGSE